MVRITNDNLNADLDHLNELREIDKENIVKIDELESLIRCIREENEKAWNMVNNLRNEKDDVLTEVEDEKANYILLKQEMTLAQQETLREQKELVRQREIHEKRAADSEARLLQFNRDIESLSRERVSSQKESNFFVTIFVSFFVTIFVTFYVTIFVTFYVTICGNFQLIFIF